MIICYNKYVFVNLTNFLKDFILGGFFMWQFWLIIAGLCIIIESITVGFFVFWFAIGALISLVASLFIDNFLIQAIIFVIASSMLIVFTKPLVKKFLKAPNVKPTNVYSIIGKEGIVLEEPIFEISYKNDDNFAIKRYIDWKRGEPYTFKLEDFNELINSGCFFARKFSTNVDKDIIDKIYDYVKGE